jgi:hypothetical protein
MSRRSYEYAGRNSYSIVSVSLKVSWVNYSSRSTNNLHVVGHIVDNKRDSVSNISACWWLNTADFTQRTQKQGDFENYDVELGLEYNEVYKIPKSFHISSLQLK